MKTFDYKGFDHEGRSRRGLIEALDLKDARDKLATRGILPERVAVAGQARRLREGRFDSRFTLDLRAVLYRELGALVYAGLPLTQAMDVLIQAPDLGEHRSALAGIRDRVREGSAFGVALSAASRKITQFELAVIEVGERAGTLDEILEKLASFLEEQVRLRDRVQTALIYPAIVFTLAVCIVLVMMGVLVPSMGRMLSESNIPIPALTRLMMAGGRLIPILIMAFLAGGGILFALERHRFAGNPGVRLEWDRRLFRLPVAGRAYAYMVNLRFSRTLSLLLRGGVPLVEGVGLAGKASGSPWVYALCVEQAEAVRHGRSLSDAVRNIGPLASALPGWIKAGEASGKLENLLDNAGDRYQQQWDRLIARSLSVLEPLLILLVGGFVLLISLSILLPILQLNRTLM